jgi:hypothetical protein
MHTNELDHVDIDIRGGYAFLSGDDSAELELSCDFILPWTQRLPPDSWTDQQKAAHAEVFGYLPYWKDIFERDTLHLIRFLQHHMVENTVAIISGTSQEEDSCWYWTVGFTNKTTVWKTQSDVEKDVERLLGLRL